MQAPQTRPMAPPHAQRADPTAGAGAAPACPAVLKVRPVRDASGQVVAPALLGLRDPGSTSIVPGAAAHIGVDPRWLDRLEAGDRILLTDARAALRALTVVCRRAAGVLVECSGATHIVAETRLRLLRHDVAQRESAVHDLPEQAARFAKAPR